MEAGKRNCWFVAIALWAAGCDGTVGPQARQLLDGGSAALQREDYQRAVADASSFLRDYPSSRGADEAYYIRGLAKYKLKDLAGARSDLQAALGRTKLKEIRVNSSNALGDLAWDADDIALSERMYRQALADIEDGKPPADQVRYRLGCVLQREGSWEQADLQFDRVIHFFGGGQFGKLSSRRVRARAWTIQVGSYQKKSLAEAAAESLRAKELPAQVEAQGEDGKLMFRVLVGRYQAYPQALAVLPVVRKIKQDVFVTVTR